MAGADAAGAGEGGPPPELIPGFYDDRIGLVIFCVVFCLSVSTIMVGLRIWTRKVIINKMGPDDWAAICAMIITWGEGIAIAISTKYGLGKHIWAVQPPSLLGNYWKMFWVTLLLYHAGLCAAKLTFLLQYYRIFALQKSRWLYIAAIVVVGAWSFAQVIIALLICRPIQGLWDRTIEAECMPNSPQIYVNAGGNILTDIAIFLLPLPAIKQLNLHKKQKWLLFGIFSLGFFTVAISVVRIKFLDIGQAGGFADITWQHVESSGWSIGELASALTCSSLPTLRPFLARYFPGLGITTQSSESAASYVPDTVGGGGGYLDSKGRVTKQFRGKSSAESWADKAELELRHGTGTTEGRAHSADGNSTGRSVTDEERLLGMGTMTRTQIQRSDSNPDRDPEQGGAIQVQRAVYQTNRTRENRGW